jgi:hypothetical protein
MASGKRKLSNYLLDKSLQLRYVALVTVISALISAALGYLIWRQEADASTYVMQAFDSFAEDTELREAISSRLTRDENRLAFTMVGAGIGLVVVLFLYLVVMTHKVAGPLYKVSRYFGQMAEGKLGDIHSLRRGDMLQDFYVTFREAHAAVRARHQEDGEVFRRFLAACDQAQVSASPPLAAELAATRMYLERRDQVTA